MSLDVKKLGNICAFARIWRLEIASYIRVVWVTEDFPGNLCNHNSEDNHHNQSIHVTEITVGFPTLSRLHTEMCVVIYVELLLADKQTWQGQAHFCKL
jgi:hypothetical protein